MRLFIAFDISKEAEKELEKAQQAIKKADPNLGFVREFHLTLKFLGEVDDSKVGEIKEKLGKIDFERFSAELDIIGVFPSENYVRVVWIGLEPKDKINALQQKIEESLKGLFEKDNRFHPHITLARVKFLKDKKGFLETLKKIKPEKISFDVNSFKLIKSTLMPEGPVYEELVSVNSR